MDNEEVDAPYFIPDFLSGIFCFTRSFLQLYCSPKLLHDLI